MEGRSTGLGGDRNHPHIYNVVRLICMYYNEHKVISATNTRVCEGGSLSDIVSLVRKLSPRCSAIYKHERRTSSKCFYLLPTISGT